MIFQIGFNRTGTSSIAEFLRQATGKKILHWERGIIAQNIAAAVRLKRKPQFRPGAFGLTDMDRMDTELGRHLAGFAAYRELHHHYPDALFILNTRDLGGWLTSKVRLHSGLHLSKWMHALGTEDLDVIQHTWSEVRRDHHQAVLEYAKATPTFNLVVFHIERDPVSKLYGAMEKAGIRYSQALNELPHKNSSFATKTGSIQNALRLQKQYPEEVRGVQARLYQEMFKVLESDASDSLKHRARLLGCLL